MEDTERLEILLSDAVKALAAILDEVRKMRRSVEELKNPKRDTSWDQDQFNRKSM